MRFDTAYFDAGIRRVGTECEKWDGMIAETGDETMIPMWVADMDFPSPPAIRDALAGVLARGTWGYTISGDADRQALCDYWAGDEVTGEGATGQVFHAEIHELGPLPESEMAEVRLFDGLPENLTYPAITPELYAVLMKEKI